MYMYLRPLLLLSVHSRHAHPVPPILAPPQDSTGPVEPVKLSQSSVQSLAAIREVRRACAITQREKLKTNTHTHKHSICTLSLVHFQKNLHTDCGKVREVPLQVYVQEWRIAVWGLQNNYYKKVKKKKRKNIILPQSSS